jgi:hypothetical protein
MATKHTEHDYSCGATKKVTLVVAPGEKYGDAVPGDRVILGEAEAAAQLRRATMGTKHRLGALMTIAEWNDLKKKKFEKEVFKKPSAQKAVDPGIAAYMREQAEAAQAKKIEALRVATGD